MLSHLTLALAGVCLTAATWFYVPESVLGLLVYLGLVWLSWKLGKRFALPGVVANLLGAFVALGVGVWFWVRLPPAPSNTHHGPAAQLSEAFLDGTFIPYLGPMLMALLVVRLYRPVRQDDFWLLQALGLLQAALGCVLGNDSLFGVCLLAYLAVGLCAVAAHEREARSRQNIEVGRSAPRWVRFALAWGLAVAACVAPLFFLAPRVEEASWQPAVRFGAPQAQASARTGFSEGIELRRGGTVENDEAVAFVVVATDEARAGRALPADQRFRGVVLDRYDEGNGTWRSDLSWPGGGPTFRYGGVPRGPAARNLEFEVGRAAGGLFLAEPLALGGLAGEMPVSNKIRNGGRLFYEAGGTAMPISFLTETNYRYVQTFAVSESDRAPVVRVYEDYRQRLLRCRVPGLEEWTAALLLRLASRPDAPEGLAEALKGPRPPGWSLPPRAFAPVAKLLEGHLARSGEYSYSLTNAPATGADPVMEFLTQTKQGSCERYASALALALRSVGIPARVVKGFRGAEHRGDGVHHVLNSHAHAWVEAMVPSQGDGSSLDWLTLDATPANDAPSGGWAQWLQQQQRSGQGLWRELVVGYGSRQQESLIEDLASGRLAERALPLLVLLLAGGVTLWLVRYVPRGWAKGRRLGGYARLRAVAARMGIDVGPTRTPREVAQDVEERLRAAPATAELADVPALVVAGHYRARWGREAAEDVALARRLRLLEKAT